MKIEINYGMLNHLFSTLFAGGIAKTLCNHDFLVKNKNLVLF